MATRSNIIVLDPSNPQTALYVYCHSDGYPSYTGRKLRDFYGAHKEALALVNLGDLSIVDDRLAPALGECHTFELPVSDVTVAYHRDRGEPWSETGPRRVELVDGYPPHRIYKSGPHFPFMYFHGGTGWWCLKRSYDRTPEKWVPLDEAIAADV